jgi:hypothetical protein
MALRARCSGLILGLYSSSVIVAPSRCMKDHHQHASHEADEFFSRRGVDRHEGLLQASRLTSSLRTVSRSLPSASRDRPQWSGPGE